MEMRHWSLARPKGERQTSPGRVRLSSNHSKSNEPCDNRQSRHARQKQHWPSQWQQQQPHPDTLNSSIPSWYVRYGTESSHSKTHCNPCLHQSRTPGVTRAVSAWYKPPTRTDKEQHLRQGRKAGVSVESLIRLDLVLYVLVCASGFVRPGLLSPSVCLSVCCLVGR